MIAGTAAGLLVLSVISPGAAFAAGDGQTALLQFNKSVTPSTLIPGQTATYTFDVNCSGDTVNCVGLKITDTIPAPLVLGTIVLTPPVPGDSESPTATASKSGNGFVVTFTNDLGGGDVGMDAGESTVFTVTASVPNDVSADYNGTPITNTAHATMADGTDQQSSANVSITVPEHLATTITKSISPASLQTVPGKTATIGLAAANASNSSVDSLTVQDPATFPSQAFGYLGVTGVSIPTWPSGADRVEVDWSTDGATWMTGSPQSTVSLPAGVDPSTIAGLRFVFTDSSGSIAQGASGTVDIATALRSTVTSLTADTSVSDTASAWDTLAGTDSPTVTSTANLAISHVTISPVATKSFSTNSTVGGKDVGVTLGGSNGGSFTLSRMTITEPAAGQPNLADQGLGFGSWTQSGIQWPVGATSAQVEYLYSGDAGYAAALTTTTRDSLPLPDPAKTVIGFAVEFDGSMLPGQFATLPFDASTQAVDADVTTTDTVSVDVVTDDGEVASTTAQASLTLRTARINTTVSKVITPDTLYSIAGSTTVVSLPAFVAPQPTSSADPLGSTIGAASLTVSDSPEPSAAAFWNSFDLAGIVATDVPSNATLDVNYWDGSAWLPLAGGTDIAAGTTVNLSLTAQQRQDVQGIQFVFTPATGTELPPGFSVQPNLRVTLRDQLRDGTGPAAGSSTTDNVVVGNTVESTVESPTAATASATGSANVTLLPSPAAAGTGGSLDLIDKSWSADLISARSQDEATAVLKWGTAALGFPSVVVSDSADDPSSTAVQNTVYDAFNLVSIPAITAKMDPLLQYDEVQSIELYHPGSGPGTGWIEPVDDPCRSGGCAGQFPGYTLSPADQDDVTGVQITFVENPDPESRIGDSVTAPLPGSGVAATMDKAREIDLDFQLRDTRRSDGSPVLGTTRGIIYNTAQAGFVSNTARANAFDADQDLLYTGTAASSIEIIDQPIDVTATKTWTATSTGSDGSAGSLGIPPVGTPSGLYPSAQLVATATNNSLVPVDELSLAEPTAGDHPFDDVNVTSIAIATPTGATSTGVILEPDTTFTANPYTVAAVQALSSTQKAEITGITVVSDGSIVPAAKITLTLTTQLRADIRNTSSPVSPTTLDNTVTATIVDPGGTDIPPAGQTDNTASAPASASLQVAAQSYGVVATKKIATDGTNASSSAPAIQYDGSSKVATITLSGQPTGNVRTTQMVIDDSSPSFWNAFDFTSFGTNSFAAPINTVEVDALVGITYDVSGPGTIVPLCDGDTDLTACWVLGTTQGGMAVPTLPAGDTLSDIRGLRFTFAKSDYSEWERPYNPLQNVTFTVTRRDDLVSGGAVPSTLHSFTAPAPGETALATFTNTVTVTASSAQSATDTDPLWSATSTDQKQIRYQHLPAMVKIQKMPVGPLPLGADIPYTIAVTNTGTTGDKVLSGVVVTDLIPSDSQGPLLVMPTDPDTTLPETTAAAFSYTLTNASGVAQPAPAVTVSPSTLTAGDGLITFTLGQTLPLGWTLTINATLDFRPLLQAGTPVLNTATVTSDQLFDQCDSSTDATQENPAQQFVDSCTSTTTVSPLPSAPLTIVKGVRGVAAGPLGSDGTPLVDGSGVPYDDLGVLKTVTTSPTDCSQPDPNLTVGGNSYYRYPCVPITRPGGTEEWVSRFTNSGNITVAKVVAIDVLPRPDDQGVIISDARGSMWTPPLSEYPQIPDLPAGASYQVEYVTQTGVATPRCNAADIQSTMGMTATTDPPIVPADVPCLSDNGNPDDLPNRDWKVLPTSPTAAELASAVALKFVITLPVDGASTGLAPGASLAIVYTSTTAAAPALAEDPGDLDRDSIAYNSIAGAAVGVTGSTDLAYRFVTEPRKVGVALATGQVQLLKTVTGDAAGAVEPASNDLDLNCTSAGQPITLADSDGNARGPITVTPGSTTTVEGLPLYASCGVTEAKDYGETSSSVVPSTVEAEAAHSTNYLVYNPHPAFDDTRPAIQLSTVTNDYDESDFTVTKAIDNGGAVDQGGTPIAYPSPSFSASCTFDNGSGTLVDVPLSLDGTSPPSTDPVTFTLGDGGSQSFSSVPAGSLCTVTETNTQHAASDDYAVTSNQVAVSSGAGPTAVFTVAAHTGATTPTNTLAFTNSYQVGSLTVDKVIAGAGAAEWGTGDFTLHATCTLNAFAPKLTVYDADIVLNSTNLQKTIDDIPAGASCVVSEAAAGRAGADAASGSVTKTIAAGTGVTATITNTFDLARLSVTKVVNTSAVDQNGAPVDPVGPFTASVVCTFQPGTAQARTVLADGYDASPMVMTLVAGRAQVLTGLPAGASCVVTETDTDGADSTTIDDTTSATSGSSATTTSKPIVLTKDSDATTGTNTATITNDYGVASFAVTKSLGGGGAAQFGVGPFVIHVDCVAPGGVSAYDGDVTLPTPAGAWTTTIDDLADNSRCSAAETNFASTGADAETIVDSHGDDTTGEDIPVTVANPGSVTIENWYLTGSVTVTKQVTGAGASDYGVGPFTVSLACTRDGDSVAIPSGAARSLLAGASTTYDGLPSGARCTLTETDRGGATASSILAANGDVLAGNVSTGYAFTVAVDDRSLTDDQAQPALVVQNSYGLASLTVTKHVTSDAVDQDGAAISYGPFPVTVDCTFQGDSIYATGYSATHPMQASLAKDQSWTLGGLAAGAACQVTETDPKDAVDPSIVTQSGSAASTTVHAATAAITLAPDTGGDVANTAVIDNPYQSGTIQLAKVVTGAGASDWGDGPFTIEVGCTLTDGSGSRDVWDESYQVSRGDAPIVLDHVASGADCTVTETRTGGANSTTVTVGSASPGTGTTAAFTSPAQTELDLVVTNEFDEASVAVTKTRDGAGAARYGAGPFEVSITCTRDIDGVPTPVDVPGGATRALTSAGGYRAGYTGLPAGADCAATETKTGGADAVVISPRSFTTDAGLPTDLELTNTFNVGGIAITKTILGAGSGLYGNGPFQVSLSCTRQVDGATVPVSIPGGPRRELTGGNGYAASYENLPQGASCLPTESKTNGATTSAFDIGSAPVTVVAGTDTAVGLTNTFDVGSIVVNNSVTGSDAKRHLNDLFAVELSCTADIDGVQTPVDIPGGASRDLGDQASVTYDMLPVGADCSLVETNTNSANTVLITWHGLPVPANSVTVGDPDFQIAVVNVFTLSLAFTGSSIALQLGLGLSGLIVGLAILLIRRRRRLG